MPQLLTSRAHQNHTEWAERIEVTGQQPRGFRVIPDFVDESGRARISSWLRTHVSWSWRGLSEMPPAQGFPNQHADMPEWSRLLADRLCGMRIFPKAPDHVYIIHYQAGKGMYPHIDKPEFGEVIACLTLDTSRIFELFPVKGRGCTRVLLLPGDLYIMSGEVRHRWKHSVPATLSDEFRGRTYPRTNGFAVTWRIHEASNGDPTKSGRSWLDSVKRAFHRE